MLIDMAEPLVITVLGGVDWEREREGERGREKGGKDG